MDSICQGRDKKTQEADFIFHKDQIGKYINCDHVMLKWRVY